MDDGKVSVRSSRSRRIEADPFRFEIWFLRWIASWGSLAGWKIPRKFTRPRQIGRER
jgi:hypothetical protein